MFPRDALVNITHINEDGSIHFSDISNTDSVDKFDTFITESTNHSANITNSDSTLNESNSSMVVFEFDKKMSDRTVEEIREEHLQNNSSLFNNLFFQPNFIEMVKNLQNNRFSYMNFFYPSFRYCNFDMRIASSIGGLYAEMLNATNENGYNISDWNYDINSDDDFKTMMITRYNERSNWFTVIAVHENDHIRYCFKLYDVVRKIINHKIDRIELLEDNEIELLKEWRSRVLIGYRNMNLATKSSFDYYKYCQVLYDLIWDPMDDPNDITICCANVFKFIETYFDDMTINEDSIIRKNDLIQYIFRDSMQSERVFLLPATSQYPILNKSSVKLAMDNIHHISEDDIEEYSNNLNRRYRELGCRFKIPANHPYAPYAISGENSIPIVVSHILYDITDTDTSTSGLKNVNIMKNIYYKNGVE